MPPWKIDRTRQQLRGWTADGLAAAHAAVAEADVQVKGEGVSAGLRAGAGHQHDRGLPLRGWPPSAAACRTSYFSMIVAV